MPQNQAQSKFALYSTILDEEERLRKKQNKIATRERKKANRAGIGRGLGALLGGLLAPVGGVGLTALMAGLGSRAGSEIGERSVGGSSQINKDNYLFGLDDIDQANFESKERARDFNTSQWVESGTDALSAGIFAGLGGSGMGEVSQAGESISTSGGVNVLGDVVKAGSRDELLKGLGRQKAMNSGYLQGTNLMQLLDKNSKQAVWKNFISLLTGGQR